jgi:hypothetical protein
MPDQQIESGVFEQDRTRDRRVKWAAVFATTIDAASKILEIIIRR